MPDLREEIRVAVEAERKRCAGIAQLFSFTYPGTDLERGIRIAVDAVASAILADYRCAAMMTDTLMQCEREKGHAGLHTFKGIDVCPVCHVAPPCQHSHPFIPPETHPWQQIAEESDAKYISTLRALTEALATIERLKDALRTAHEAMNNQSASPSPEEPGETK